MTLAIFFDRIEFDDAWCHLYESLSLLEEGVGTVTMYHKFSDYGHNIHSFLLKNVLDLDTQFLTTTT